MTFKSPGKSGAERSRDGEGGVGSVSGGREGELE